MSEPPQPPVDQPEWYYVRFQNRLGPVSTNQMLLLIDTRRIDASTLVWRQGMASWAPAASVPEFCFAFRSSIQGVLNSKNEFALGLNTGGFILFIVLLFWCIPLCWIPWVIPSLKARV